MKQLKVIIAGGGTGGHIFPAIAIGHAIQRAQPGSSLLFVGANGKMEMEKVPLEGFDIVGLDIVGFNRSSILKNIGLPYRLYRSFVEAKHILKRFKPDVVIGVGGYASFPILKAAQKMGIPTLVQEQNSYAGKSNKILGRRARAICVAYDKMEEFFPKEKIRYTGNPVRKTIAQAAISREEGLAWLGKGSGRHTLLVIGGSLGAKAINESIDKHLEELTALGLQVIWQTGTPYYEQAIRRAEGNPAVVVKAFIREMEYAYAAADIIVSRAGALAIAELCIVAKPVIFVPYPHAAEDHQTSNAMALVEHNAALVVTDSNAKTELLPKLRHLLNDASMQELMHENLKKMAVRDADDKIAQIVVEIAKETSNV